MKHDLNLISNFTFYLAIRNMAIGRAGPPLRGGHGSRSGGWGASSAVRCSTCGIQLRERQYPTVALYHTERRVRLDTRSDSSALVTSLGGYGQTDLEWSPHLRFTGGIRVDGSHYRVDALDTVNSGTASAGMVSPKGGATFGPWKATEFYVNGGFGFHSNNALGTTITRDPEGNPAERVTPLVRAKGAEVGVRSVAVPHLQSTVSLWTLRLGSELVYNGDIGAEPTPSERHAWNHNYYSPLSGCCSTRTVALVRYHEPWIRRRSVPEVVNTVVSAGASVDGFHRTFGSIRWRYFGRGRSWRTTRSSRGHRLREQTAIGRGPMRATRRSTCRCRASGIDYYFHVAPAGERLAGTTCIPPSHARLAATDVLKLELRSQKSELIARPRCLSLCLLTKFWVPDLLM